MEKTMITRERMGTEIGLMTGRIKQTLLNGRDNLANAGTAVSQKTRRAVRKTDYYVHDNAWKMIGVAAGLALAAGYVISRMSGEERAIPDQGQPMDSHGDLKVAKKQQSGSWELVHAVIPLALFAWKAFQSSRCQKRGTAS